MCDFWRVVGVVFFDVALSNVFGCCGCDDHIELFDVDATVGDVVIVELLELLSSVVLKIVPHCFFVIGEYFVFVCVQVIIV